MKIEQVPINDLKEADYNPRQLTEDQHKHLTESIQKFGLVDPIIVNKHKGRENVVIGGHQRLKIARQLAFETVPVVYLDLDLEREKELNLRLNKNLGQWDWNKLANEFDIDYLLNLGFTEHEIGVDFLEEKKEDDDVPDVEGDPKTKLGDLYALGDHRVLCGDATKIEDFNLLMGDKKADMVFTDPPYNVDYGGGIHADGTQTKRRKILNDKMTSDNFYKFLLSVCSNLVVYTKGAFYICMSSSELHNLWKAFTDAGGHWQEYIIWAKDHFTLSGTDYQKQFEPIMYGLTESAAATLESIPDDSKDGETILYGWTKHQWYGGRKQGNVWFCDRPKKSKEHPTMKPVMLCAKAVINSCPKGGLVLDAFLGSGSTLIAAQKTGRICYGMELDPHYVDVIIKRWEEYSGGKAVKLSPTLPS